MGFYQYNSKKPLSNQRVTLSSRGRVDSVSGQKYAQILKHLIVMIGYADTQLPETQYQQDWLLQLLDNKDPDFGRPDTEFDSISGL